MLPRLALNSHRPSTIPTSPALGVRHAPLQPVVTLRNSWDSSHTEIISLLTTACLAGRVRHVCGQPGYPVPCGSSSGFVSEHLVTSLLPQGPRQLGTRARLSGFNERTKEKQEWRNELIFFPLFSFKTVLQYNPGYPQIRHPPASCLPSIKIIGVSCHTWLD